MVEKVAVQSGIDPLVKAEEAARDAGNEQKHECGKS
jgi:hypothetical protein